MHGAALVPQLDHGVCPSTAAHNRVSWSWKGSEMDNEDNCKYSKGTTTYTGNLKPWGGGNQTTKNVWEGEDKRL